MARSDIRFQTVLKQARQLPPQDQRRLATALLHSLHENEHVNLILIRRFKENVQARFQELMDRNREGRLTSIEHDELKVLAAGNEALTLVNTETLLQSTYPELFSPSGRLNRKRLVSALRRKIRTGSWVARWK